MVRFGDESFERLAGDVAFCLENLRDPGCGLEHAGRFYEEASEALRGHAILRLLVDANAKGFSNDLVMSGQARRAFLGRCARHGHDDYHRALARSGAMVDAIAANDLRLAAEILALSPTAVRKGDEYEDDFWWQRVLGLLAAGAPDPELDAAIAALDVASEGAGARLVIARALRSRDAQAFEVAFRDLLSEREIVNEEDAPRAAEDLTAALDQQVWVEGVAILRLARRRGLATAAEYPMCPHLALVEAPAATPDDEFAVP